MHVPLQHVAPELQNVPAGAHASQRPPVHEPLQHSCAVAQVVAPARQASQVPPTWQ